MVRQSTNLTIEYANYMAFRNMGFRAVVAYGISKYGMSFLTSYLMGEVL